MGIHGWRTLDSDENMDLIFFFFENVGKTWFYTCIFVLHFLRTIFSTCQSISLKKVYNFFRKKSLVVSAFEWKVLTKYFLSPFSIKANLVIIVNCWCRILLLSKCNKTNRCFIYFCTYNNCNASVMFSCLISYVNSNFSFALSNSMKHWVAWPWIASLLRYLDRKNTRFLSFCRQFCSWCVNFISIYGFMFHQWRS